MTFRLLLSAVAALGLATVHGENWPRFRGPGGQGHSAETGLTVEWSAEKNVRWKAEVPGEGWSSPIVWGDHIFLTSTTEAGTKCHVLAYDRKTGKELWNTLVFDQVPQRKEGKNSFATPTPCTDGERVYAVFNDGSMVAVDFSGKTVWTNREVKFYSRHGLGSSPIVHDGLVIMPYDGSNRVGQAGAGASVSKDERVGWQIPWDQAEVVAVDAKTGKRAWSSKRGMSRIAHLTPLVIGEGAGTQILSAAGDVVQGFAPKTGELLWTVRSEGEGVTPSPAFGDGLIYTAAGFGKPTIRAIKLGAKGESTETHIAWEQRKGMPTQSALLYVSPYLYSITDAGVAYCFEGKTGDVVWSQRVGGNFSASPVYADGRIYLLSEQGETTVMAPGKEYKELARNPLGERAQASMAVSQGNLFIRTEKTLWCIGGKQSGE